MLRLCDLLQQLLDDDAVVVADVRGCDLEMVDGGDDVEFELAGGRGLEDAGVDFDLLGARTVEGAERGEDAGLFAGAAGAVEEEVGEVGGGCLGIISFSVVRWASEVVGGPMKRVCLRGLGGM